MERFYETTHPGTQRLRYRHRPSDSTRECLAREADTGLGSGRVTWVLEPPIGERGRPENLRSDNGPEFTSRRMLGWTEDWKVGLVPIQPSRPMQNGHVESSRRAVGKFYKRGCQEKNTSFYPQGGFGFLTSSLACSVEPSTSPPGAESSVDNKKAGSREFRVVRTSSGHR